jgi:hypothetical protein
LKHFHPRRAICGKCFVRVIPFFPKRGFIMAHKMKHVERVPPANKSRSGPSPDAMPETTTGHHSEVDSSQEQDPKRRQGDFSQAADHPPQQPGPLNDGGQPSR